MRQFCSAADVFKSAVHRRYSTATIAETRVSTFDYLPQVVIIPAATPNMIAVAVQPFFAALEASEFLSALNSTSSTSLQTYSVRLRRH
jgi:hypothetical protein